jgi:UDP-N-acetylmuramoyl-tripeptide--D-alanyl-D-alanine ligase
MEPRTLKYMAEACQSRQWSGAPGTLVERVCLDSRQVRANDLFVAIRGERHDGHAFLKEAAQNNAAAILVDCGCLPSPAPGCGVVCVGDTRVALGRIAARYRLDFPVPLIAVGGSNGKTTTKDLLAAVLSQRFKTLSSHASFNNNIGVPRTLLELRHEHQVAVLEFGSNHPGELAPLLEMARPRFGVITSIGREHLEFFGDLDGVAREEGWIAEALPPDGKLFVNGDSPKLELILKRCSAAVVRAGFGPENDWRAMEVEMDERGVAFRVEAPATEYSRLFRVPLLGRHQASNALLALAAAAEFGLGPEEAQRGLLACAPARMRLEVWSARGVKVIDDSYNANADSMLAALETLRDFPCAGRRVAVLGEMSELGEHSTLAHAETGMLAARSKVDRLLVVGEMGSITARAAREAGLEEVAQCDTAEAAAAELKASLRPGDVLLLKASRAMQFERIAALLRGSDSGELK